jgi:hypothetical protein
MTVACDVRDESGAGPGAALRTLARRLAEAQCPNPSSLLPIPCYVGLNSTNHERAEN